MEDEKRKSDKISEDGVEDISSDLSSDNYSHLNSSSDNDDDDDDDKKSKGK